MTLAERRLKVGLLIDTDRLMSWHLALMDYLIGSDHTEVPLVIRVQSIRTSPSKGSFFFSRDRLARSIWRWVTNLESVSKIGRSSSLLKRIPLPAHISALPSCAITCGSNGAPLLSSSQSDQLHEYQLDVLLDLSGCVGVLEFVSYATHGIWQPRFSGTKSATDEMIGFVDFKEKHGVARAELVAANANQEGWFLFADANFAADNNSVNDTTSTCAHAAIALISRELNIVARYGIINSARDRDQRIHVPSVQYGASREFSPGSLAVVGAVARASFNRVRNALNNALLREQWFLLFAFGDPSEPRRDFANFTRIEPPSDRFWADPHVVFWQGKWIVFIEELIYTDRRGTLAYFEVSQTGGWRGPFPVLNLPYHLSYPHVFQYQGDWYMVPESFEARRIDLYRAKSFPDEWEFYRTLVEDIDAVDPTVFHYDGIWWMFAGVKGQFGRTHQESLYLFFTDDLLQGTWSEHPSNPVLIDVLSARPAGKLFHIGSDLIRPSQDCGRRYGYSINLNKIIHLTERSFVESVSEKIQPWDAAIIGTHTIGFANGLTVVDGLRWLSRAF